MSHPMMPLPTHDERAEQLFVRDLKVYLGQEIEPAGAQLAEALEAERGTKITAPEQVEDLYNQLLDYETFRTTMSLKRTAQEMMWDGVGASIDRQADVLMERARNVKSNGSVRLDPAFEAPSYITNQDTHLMPGGYAADEGEGSIRQGALMDRGGAVYMLGRNGGMMNDGRGHTTAAHLFDVYPDLKPKRILEMGCGVGVSAVAMASYFPEAEFHAIDVGASVLRYAHARAAHLGANIHFSQQSAERTDFEDGYFDLIFTCVMFHETALTAMPRFFAEMHRLLRPGGVVINLEVPARYGQMSLWSKINGEFETQFNNEPYWRGAITADYRKLFTDAGFEDLKIGYQPAAAKADPSVRGQFADEPTGPGMNWFIASARK